LVLPVLEWDLPGSTRPTCFASQRSCHAKLRSLCLHGLLKI
jgi:hypothetical protein